MICQQCGRENYNHATFCAECGARVGGQTYGSDPSQWQHANTYSMPKSGSNRALAVISYFTIIGLLVAIFCGDKDDEYLRFHENQALVMSIAGIICAIFSWLPLLQPLAWLGSMFVGVCAIFGIIYAAKGWAKPVLFFSDWQIIK